MPAVALQWAAGEDCISPDDGTPFFQIAEYDSDLIQSLAIIAVALPMNVIILTGYMFLPPHPKFLLRCWYRFSVRTHIMSGSVEIIAGILMWFLPHPELVIKIQCVCALIHCATALNHLPLLFGTKVMMNSGYGSLIMLKAYLAVSSFMHPYCYKRVVALTVVHTIYAWVRMIWLFLKFADIFRRSQYTAACMTATMVVLPCVCESGNVFLVMVCLVYFGGVWIFAKDRGHYLREYSRDVKTLSNFDCPFSCMKAASATDQAKAVFNLIDTDRSGKIDIAELANLLTSFGMPASEAAHTMKIFDGVDTKKDGKIEFDTFMVHMKCVWEHIYYEAITEEQDKKKRQEYAQRHSESHLDFKAQYKAQHGLEDSVPLNGYAPLPQAQSGTTLEASD